jgi:hypothetical protein
MNLISQLVAQTKQLYKFFFLIYIPPLLFLAAIALGALLKNKQIGTYTRDPSVTAQISPYVGIVSNAGALVWTMGASICLFTGLIFYLKKPKISQEKRISQFFMFAGSLTTLLLFDDFFLLHDHTFLYVYYIDEKIIYSVYLALLITLLIKFKSYVLTTTYVLLLTSFSFFSLSILIDLIQPLIESVIGENLRILLEDGAKLMGIVGWSAYFSKCAFDEINANFNTINMN